MTGGRMEGTRAFLKSTAVYMVGTVASKAIWVVLMPLFTRLIAPADYGTYDVNVSLVLLLSSLVYLEVWNAALRFMFDYEGAGKGGPARAAWASFGVSTVLFLLALLLADATIYPVEHLWYVFLYGLTTNLANLSGYIARGFGRSTVFMAGGLAGALMTVVCNVALLYGAGMGYEAMYLSFSLGYIVNALVTGLGVRREAFPRVRGLLRPMLRYALPLSLNSIAYWFMTSYARLAISQRLGSYENGLYAMAAKFGLLITLITQAFQFAWAELSFSRAGEDKKTLGVFYTRAFDEYIRFMALGVMLLLPAIRLLFPLLVGEQYRGAEGVIPLYVVGTLLGVFCEFLTSMFMTIKKTRVILYSTGVGSLLNVLLLGWLLPVLGVTAANLALVAGFLCSLVIRLAALRVEVGLAVRPGTALLAALGIALAAVVFLYAGIWVNVLAMGLFLGVFARLYGGRALSMLRGARSLPPEQDDDGA